MTTFPTKTAAVTALVALGCVMSHSANANILRTNAGVPVWTKDGQCVLTGTDGGADCPTAGEVSSEEMSHERVVYFDFNKSTLTSEAKHHLSRLAHHLHAEAKRHHGHMTELSVVGFADRIGDAGYNHKLAMKRAVAVRNYLVSKGIKPKKIEVRSLGKSEPKADCPADLSRNKLIKCLREDRRVEIEFIAK